VKKVEAEAKIAVSTSLSVLRTEFNESTVRYSLPQMFRDKSLTLQYKLWFSRVDEAISQMKRGLDANSYGVQKECTCVWEDLGSPQPTAAYVHADRTALLADNDIHFCPKFFKLTFEVQVQTFIHETSHYFANTDDIDYKKTARTPHQGLSRG